MKTYFTWYSTGEYGKLWFKANSSEEARELLEKVRDNQMSIDDLEGVEMKPKGSSNFEFDRPEEWD
jgi:hypothetical protein